MSAVCRVDGCDKAPPPSAGGTLCGKHRHRLLRHGDVEAVHVPHGWVSVNGYPNQAAHGHPLRRNDRVNEGRIVLYAKLGPGSHPCHWCQRPVEWGVDLRAARLNGDKTDASPDNLAPACAACILRRTTDQRWGDTRHEGTHRPPPLAISRLQNVADEDGS